MLIECRLILKYDAAKRQQLVSFLLSLAKPNIKMWTFFKDQLHREVLILDKCRHLKFVNQQNYLWYCFCKIKAHFCILSTASCFVLCCILISSRNPGHGAGSLDCEKKIICTNVYSSQCILLFHALCACFALSLMMLVGFLWVWKDTAGVRAQLCLNENFKLELSLCKNEWEKDGSHWSTWEMLAIHLMFHTGGYFLEFKKTWWIVNLLIPLPCPHVSVIYFYHISLEVCAPYLYQP